jgi:hypothetical protein
MKNKNEPAIFKPIVPQPKTAIRTILIFRSIKNDVYIYRIYIFEYRRDFFFLIVLLILPGQLDLAGRTREQKRSKELHKKITSKKKRKQCSVCIYVFYPSSSS